MGNWNSILGIASLEAYWCFVAKTNYKNCDKFILHLYTAQIRPPTTFHMYMVNQLAHVWGVTQLMKYTVNVFEPGFWKPR